jgi:hypothetical protein
MASSGTPGTAIQVTGTTPPPPAAVVTEVLSSEDRWKEQIGFITAYVLVVGVSAMQLWSSTAAFQTGRNVTVLTMNTPGQGLDISVFEYQLLVTALAGALTALGFSVIHILARGLWLGIGFRADGQLPSHETDISDGLRRLSEFAYDATMVLILYFFAYSGTVLLFLFSAIFEHLLEYFGVPLRVAGWIGRMGSVLIFIVVGIILLFRFRDWAVKILSLAFKEVGLKTVILSQVVILFVYLIVVQSCYTASVATTGQVFHQQRDDEIELHLDLGGATSPKQLATVTLQDEHGKATQIPNFQDMGDGHYLALMRSRSLAAGRYKLGLDYPHWNFSVKFPFMQTQISRERWFLVVP